ncbi:unnamed protein product [Paramecium sonneborni]|uniref:JAB1/MPN/MOV34 metalloenzyme domain-containing protein n=2 Tax=Paramecium sonneborni TaxID=65129 RepID=A0A8S1LYJ0_9CILI|nr:unnamed protein product [Paramecium sonneborni]
MAQETVDLCCNINFEIDIHPLVIIQILDLHYRKFGASRQEETIVGGALLGTVYTNKVHITECFALLVDPGDEKNEYTFDFGDAKDLYLSHIQANPQEVLLGGFVTTKNLQLDIGVAYLSTEFSKKENGFNATAVLGQPIILKINPTLNLNKIEMKAFKLNQSLKHYAAVASFNTMPIKISFSDENLQQVWPFLAPNLQQKDFKIVNTANPSLLVSENIKNIEKILSYLEKVIAGNEVGDQDFGRKLLSTLNQIDLIRNESEVLLSQVEEAQLFQYIANFAQGQAFINEKMQKM